jgi:hypothetical protein
MKQNKLGLRENISVGNFLGQSSTDGVVVINQPIVVSVSQPDGALFILQPRTPLGHVVPRMS